MDDLDRALAHAKSSVERLERLERQRETLLERVERRRSAEAQADDRGGLLSGVIFGRRRSPEQPPPDLQPRGEREEIERLDAEIRALGPVRARLDALVHHKLRLLLQIGGPKAEEAQALRQAGEALEREIGELDRVIAVGQRALLELGDARAQLDTAKTLSIVDVFAGDLARESKLHQMQMADHALARAEIELERFGEALGRLGESGSHSASFPLVSEAGGSNDLSLFRTIWTVRGQVATTLQKLDRALGTLEAWRERARSDLQVGRHRLLALILSPGPDEAA